jgi:putative membrane protein
MHKRKLIALLTGTAALAVGSAAWAQSTPSTVGSTTTGSTTTEDRAVGTSTTSSSTTTSGQSTSDTSATTDSGSGNTNTTSPTGTTTGTTSRGTTTATDTTPAAAGTSPTPAGTSGTAGATGTTNASGTYGTATSGTSGSTGRTASLAGTDATFLRKAMEGGLEEVQRAQAAMRSAQRAEVRNVASMMLEDHRRTNEKLTQLASSKGWDVPSTASTAESDQSRIAAGPGFDDNYLEDEIRHHRETISLFRAQASSGSDPDLRQFARDTLPGLEHHLEMLQGSYSAK